MKKKYIVELEDNQILYTAVKDKDGVPFIKLLQTSPYTAPDLEQVKDDAYTEGYDGGHKVGYAMGLDDAWEAARTIIKMEWEEKNKIFGKLILLSNIFSDNTAAEAIEKLKQYEQEQDAEIKVGDEVGYYGVADEHGNVNYSGVVLEIREEDYLVMEKTGKTYALKKKLVMSKTGRHFPEIAAVLEKMRKRQEQ